MAENAALRERVAALERMVSRNSGNSGMPPSVDDLPDRKRPKDRAPDSIAGRRPGKQPGAEGKALAWSDEVADSDIVEHYPHGRCGCGAALARAADLEGDRPAPADRDPAGGGRRLQHHLHAVACRCGRVHDAIDLGTRDHQLCVAHLLRDLEDRAETYPDARWPRQLQMALRGLVHAANLAPAHGEDAIAPGTLAMFTKMFRGGLGHARRACRRPAGHRRRRLLLQLNS